jgi:hypothetical protein
MKGGKDKQIFLKSHVTKNDQSPKEVKNNS